MRPTKRAKRHASVPIHMELGDESASHSNAPLATATSASPTPMADEMTTIVGGTELAPGDIIEARGLDPCGGRQWFQARVMALRARFPPIYVKYTATLDGVTVRLALPQPVTAALHADDVRRPGA